MASASNDDQILEGFICPICKEDLKSATQLTNHFERLHQEEQDVLRSLKEIFGKAKKKILNIEESDLKDTFEKTLKFSQNDLYFAVREPQILGVSRSSMDYFRGVRSARIERYATETNKLLIRLDKLVTNMPMEPSLRKQHEQDVVPWLDGSSVKLCPNCAKSFSLARRKHHCRLCGSLLCHDCSVFLDLQVAKAMVDPSLPMPMPSGASGGSGSGSGSGGSSDVAKESGLRLCEHCAALVELRRQAQCGRHAATPLGLAYRHMRELVEQARPAVSMYEKMCQSLFEGETTYNLSDVNALRGKIGKMAEGIDSLSKQIAALPAQPASRDHKLHAAIRQAASHYIKEELLSLRKLPSDAQIADVQRERYERAERQIRDERRRMAAEAEAAAAAHPAAPAAPPAAPAPAPPAHLPDDSPLLEQMNIIRDYIRQARHDMKYEEVAILEANLKELKKEYQLLMLSMKS